ncbi:MAG: hypothetical protein NZ556_04880 [Fimbriimonadales bacterium]|nr:hypothetical protein [Fimbriimonadales bacterium]
MTTWRAELIWRTGQEPLTEALAGAALFLARHLGYPALRYEAWQLEGEQAWREAIAYLRTRRQKEDLADLTELLLRLAQKES